MAWRDTVDVIAFVGRAANAVVYMLVHPAAWRLPSISRQMVWIANAGDRDDVAYRIRFAESVSGLALGDPVKFRGVDVGKVETIVLDPDNPKLVQVEVRLRKDAPVKTDTKASLRLKGITGLLYVELDGGSAAAPSLAAATPEGQVPEIAYQKSSITTLAEQLPTVLRKFPALEDKAGKVLADVGGVTSQIKEDQSVLLFGPKEAHDSARAPEAGNAGPAGLREQCPMTAQLRYGTVALR